MDEKNLVIIGIIVLTLACFGAVVYLGTGVEAAVINYIVNAFQYSIVSLGSLATGVAIGTVRKQKKIEEKKE